MNSKITAGEQRKNGVTQHQKNQNNTQKLEHNDF
jgi:hypothetical protein